MINYNGESRCVRDRSEKPAVFQTIVWMTRTCNVKPDYQQAVLAGLLVGTPK
jgi:hypothetical protein